MWISELGGLPEPFETVICYGLIADCLPEKPFVNFAYLDYYQMWHFHSKANTGGMHVTHWQPLPEPPKDD